MKIKKKFPNKKYLNFEEFSKNYIKTLEDSAKMIDWATLEKISKIIENTIKSGNTIFVCGNGGSASIANHFLCDFAKGLNISDRLKPRIFSLSTNIEIITALGNDISFEKIFANQLNVFVKKKDILINFSVSGNSPNVIEAAKLARRKKIKVLSFTGFTKSNLEKYSDHLICFNVLNYGIAEDFFQILTHYISQFLKQKNLTEKEISKLLF
jgi:D-sedoheptulose 7-phosphate isomerase